MLLQALQPGGGGFGLDTHLFGSMYEFSSCKSLPHALHKRIAVGISPTGHLGGGQEGEYVDGVAVEAFGERQHSVEIVGGDAESP